MKLLLVEDSHVLQRSLSNGLRNSGYVVDQAYDGQAAIGYTEATTYDVIILDVMLPKLNGLEILQKIRLDGNRAPVLILSAKDEVEDRIKGLDIGADDYLVKPFSFEELLSRLRALTRRGNKSPKGVSSVIEIGPVVLDTTNRAVTVAGNQLVLTPSEYGILELLCSRQNQIFSHDHLIDRLYGSEQSVTRNAVEAHISTLRRKLKSSGLDEYIKTRRGFGYYVE